MIFGSTVRKVFLPSFKVVQSAIERFLLIINEEVIHHYMSVAQMLHFRLFVTFLINVQSSLITDFCHKKVSLLYKINEITSLEYNVTPFHARKANILN